MNFDRKKSFIYSHKGLRDGNIRRVAREKVRRGDVEGEGGKGFGRWRGAHVLVIVVGREGEREVIVDVVVEDVDVVFVDDDVVVVNIVIIIIIMIILRTINTITTIKRISIEPPLAPKIPSPSPLPLFP